MRDRAQLIAKLVQDAAWTKTRGADGWGWAWCGGVTPSFDARSSKLVIVVEVDRDHADEARARTLVDEIEASIRERYPDLTETLAWHFHPTTRVEHARELVADHFDACAERDHHPWLRLGNVAPRIGWTPALDRVSVELVVESSADEAAGQRIGEAWLAELAPRHIADLVVLECLSH